MLGSRVNETDQLRLSNPSTSCPLEGAGKDRDTRYSVSPARNITEALSRVRNELPLIVQASRRSLAVQRGTMVAIGPYYIDEQCAAKELVSAPI